MAWMSWKSRLDVGLQRVGTWSSLICSASVSGSKPQLQNAMQAWTGGFLSCRNPSMRSPSTTDMTRALQALSSVMQLLGSRRLVPTESEALELRGERCTSELWLLGLSGLVMVAATAVAVAAEGGNNQPLRYSELVLDGGLCGCGDC